jgi:hypothetical protein
MVDVTLEAGAWLHVRVHDAGQNLGRAEQRRSGKAFELGVRGIRGTYLEFEEISRDNGGRNLRVLIPRGRDVAVFLDPGDLDVDDSEGKPVRGNAPVRTVRLSDRDQSVEVRVKP